MLKFLRKYNKWILVVAGCFLMVAFLAPQAIQQWGQNQENRVVGRIGEDRVRLGDLRMAGVEAGLAEMALPAGLLDERDKSAHWLLLRTEADRAGYIAGAGDGAALLDEMARQVGYEMGFQQWMAQEFEGIPQQFLSQIRGQVEQQWQSQWMSDQAMQDALTEQGRSFIIGQIPGPITQQELYESLARVRGVQRMFREWSQAGALSERRALAEIKEIGRQAWGRALVLPASDLAAGMPEPTDEELQAHFERFDDVSAAEGEYGFGYTLPPRIKLQTLIVDRQAIEETITPDAIEVRKLWASQRQPAGPYPEDFAEARDAVEAQVTGQIADAVMEIARQAVRAALWPEIRQLDAKGAYKVVTDEFLAQRPSLEDVAQSVKRRVAESSFPLAAGQSVQIDAPVVRVYDRWLTPQDISELEVVGQASLQYAGGRVPLSQALFQVREIAGENNLGLQQNITPVQMPAVMPDGSLIYYTVLDTRPQSPPDSMGEIREQVIEDLKTLQAYERLTSELESYRSLAIAEGLEAAADRFVEALADAGIEIAVEEDEGAQPEEPEEGEEGEVEEEEAAGGVEPPPVTGEVRFTTQRAVQDGMPINELSHEVVLEAVLDAAEQLDPAAALDSLDPEQATVAVPVDKEMAVSLVRILAPRPITREQVRSDAMAFTRFVMEREMAGAGLEENPFGFDALRERLNYVDLEQRDQDADEADAADPAGATAPSGEPDAADGEATGSEPDAG